MAAQIDKGTFRCVIMPKEKRIAKKLHRKQKRREAKKIDEANPQYNRYTDGWCS